MMGNKDNIFILPNEGNYVVKSLDEHIATGEIKQTDNGDGSISLLSVSVTPVSKGKTTFVISNGIEEKKVDVTVVDAYMVFDVGNQVFSSVGESDKSEVGMKELQKDPFLSMNNVFMLVKDEAHTMYLFESLDDVEIDETSRSTSQRTYKSKGSYEMVKSGDTYYMVLKSGDRFFRFEIGGNPTGQSILKSFFNLNGLKSESSVPEYLAQVTFTEDLTEEYNNKFQGDSHLWDVITLAQCYLREYISYRLRNNGITKPKKGLCRVKCIVSFLFSDIFNHCLNCWK